MRTFINSKKNLPFNVSNLAKRLHFSRITLYKYFDLFDSLKNDSSLSHHHSFDDKDIAKVLGKQDIRYNKDRLEFLNQLSKFYWDAIKQNKFSKSDNYFENLLEEYVSPSLIEKNLTNKKLKRKGSQQSFVNLESVYNELHENIPLKEYELVKVFGDFLNDIKETRIQNKDEKYQLLIDYIEYLRYKVNKGK